MFILFALIFMRMTGAVMFNPVLGRTNLPRSYKGALIFALSLMMYLGVEGVLEHEPSTMIEYGVMLVLELAVGFVLGFSMELFFMIIRFASSIMDHTMGLSMAQSYDPTTNTQMTVSSGLFYAFLFLLFLAGDGHVRFLGLMFASARLIPFGQVEFGPEVSRMMLEIFKVNIVTGLQFAFPIIGDRGGSGYPYEDDTSDQCVCGQLPAEDPCGINDASVYVQPYVGQIICDPG